MRRQTCVRCGAALRQGLTICKSHDRVGETARGLRGGGEDDVGRGMGTALVPFLL